MNKALWVVSLVDIGGLAYSSIAKNRDDAVSAFMSHVYMLVHSFQEAAFWIVGEDEDAALTGLHCLMRLDEEWLCVVSMTSPAVIAPQPNSTTFPWEDARFVRIAADIQTAVAKHQSLISPEERERLNNSKVAVLFPRNGVKGLIQSAQENQQPIKNFSGDRAAKVWNAMRRVKQFEHITATMR